MNTAPQPDIHAQVEALRMTFPRYKDVPPA
jgi:hypothetical protein